MLSWVIAYVLCFQTDLIWSDEQAVNIHVRPADFWCKLPCPKDAEHTMCVYEEADSTSYCWDTVYQMSLGKREAILDWHNDLRDFVAGGGLGKKASNMRALTWDFELEQVARRWAFQCKRSKDACRTTEHYSHYNVSQNVGWVTTEIEKELPPTKTILEHWNDTKSGFYDAHLRKYRHYLQLRNPEAAGNPFIQMSKACLEKVGCGEVIYVQGQAHRRFLTCNYAPSQCKQHNPNDEFDRKLFKVGTPCSDCPLATDCHFFDSGYKHLCQRHHGSGKKPVLRNPGDESMGTILESTGTVVAVVFYHAIRLT